MATTPPPAPLLVAVSLDGFRWDYPELHGAPNLLALAGEGIRAASLVPQFPSKTYPNHYSIVTGLRPEHHGIVANTMQDPLFGARFSLADRAAVEDGRWWEGEPIWVTAERAGLRTASSFWPGSEAEIAGVRPSLWKRYDDSVADEVRADEALSWLDLPAAKRPRLLLFYLAEPDRSGHRFGPRSDETAAAVHHADAIVGRLRAGVEARGLGPSTDWVVVSDHGMAAVDPDRTIVLEEWIDLAEVEMVDLNIVGTLRPRTGTEDDLVRRLSRAGPHLHAARREDLPARFHYRDHRRIPPVVVWVDPGWTLVATRDERDRRRQDPQLGAHGYDPAEPAMHGIFVAAGPSFRRGVDLPAVENLDLYDIFCWVLSLPAAANDGSVATARAILKRAAANPDLRHR
ncbi:MAG: ectonucleotide pyrophosphatase/phosphodiesterase [Thermoanaerobaculia bacterium]